MSGGAVVAVPVRFSYSARRVVLKAMRNPLSRFLRRQVLALVARLRPPAETPGELRIGIELPNRLPVPEAYGGLAGNRGMRNMSICRRFPTVCWHRHN